MLFDLTELLKSVGNETDIIADENVSFPEDDLTLTKPVKMRLHFINAGESVLVNGSLETEIEQSCARCVNPFRALLIVNISEEYAKSSGNAKPAKKRKTMELKDEDFIFPINADNTLDLKETIRQNLLLALPIKPLCRPECKGE